MTERIIMSSEEIITGSDDSVQNERVATQTVVTKVQSIMSPAMERCQDVYQPAIKRYREVFKKHGNHNELVWAVTTDFLRKRGICNINELGNKQEIVEMFADITNVVWDAAIETKYLIYDRGRASVEVETHVYDVHSLGFRNRCRKAIAKVSITPKF